VISKVGAGAGVRDEGAEWEDAEPAPVEERAATPAGTGGELEREMIRQCQ